MSNRSKKIFLALSVVVPFLIYCFYYYGMMVKNAPYKFSEFESFTFKYGLGDSLVNQYDSKTAQYQYVTDKDSLVKKKVKLSKDQLLYLHRKAAQLGFWNFPSEIVNSEETSRPNSPHYYIEFNYERKTKKVLFDLDFNGDPKLKDAVRHLIEELSSMINDAEDQTNQRR
ncbi:hypothetical protein ACFSJU_16825 [Paradesertivirga mongoliensis]|uniref:Uncharacterized protein n=1 Tax=Paradesertivirga mongoliensis TaxID=2100740 RepID=A0ABW4ZQ82_9SPHI|nr:hypothetical protein [Pedobacter mongoliensis]